MKKTEEKMEKAQKPWSQFKMLQLLLFVLVMKLKFLKWPKALHHLDPAFLSNDRSPQVERLFKQLLLTLLIIRAELGEETGLRIELWLLDGEAGARSFDVYPEVRALLLLLFTPAKRVHFSSLHISLNE